MKRFDINEINESLHSKKAAKRETKSVAEVNKALRLKSPAGRKAALDELAQRTQAKPVAKPRPVKPALKQQPKLRLNISALIAALSNVRSHVGSLPATVLSDVKTGDKKMAAICKELLAIEQSLEPLK